VVVGSYERGDRAVTVQRLSEIAVSYGVPVSELLPDPRPSSAVTSKSGASPQSTLTRPDRPPGNAGSLQRSHRSGLSDVAAVSGPSPAPSPGRLDR
jgi:transcriptional regulator with XRE-family HTH domain